MEGEIFSGCAFRTGLIGRLAMWQLTAGPNGVASMRLTGKTRALCSGQNDPFCTSSTLVWEIWLRVRGRTGLGVGLGVRLGVEQGWHRSRFKV